MLSMNCFFPMKTSHDNGGDPLNFGMLHCFKIRGSLFLSWLKFSGFARRNPRPSQSSMTNSFFFLTCWFSMAVKSDLYWFMIYRWFSTSQSVELSEGSLFFSMRAEVLIWKAWRSSVHRIALTRLEGTGKIWKISVFVGIKGVFYMWSYQRLTLPTLTFGSILDMAIRFFLVARCGETRSLQATGKVKPRIAGGFFDKGDG